MIKPRFAVSLRIAVRQSSSDPCKPFYQIKVINLSGRNIINMTASLGIHEFNLNNHGPTRKLIHSIALKPSNPTFIGPRTRKYDPWSITSVHYYTSKPDEDVEKLLEEGRKLVFTIHATDATSGTTVIKRVLYEKKDLVKGYFEAKTGLRVLPFSGGQEAAQQSKFSRPPTSAADLRR